MAKGKDAAAVKQDAVRLVQQVLETGKLDSVYRDVYAERGAELLGPIVSREAYERLTAQRDESQHLLDQNRRAVERRDWAQAKQLSERAQAIRVELAARADELAAAEATYEETAIYLDPFSPGYELVAEQQGQNLATLRADLLTRLDALAKGDADRAPFYTARRGYFDGLAVADSRAAKSTAAVDPAQLEHEAARAAAHGEFGRVAKLADEILRRQQEAATRGPDTGPSHDLASYESPVDVAAAFPEDSVRRAESLGLSAASLPLRREDVGALIDFMYRNAWHPSFRESGAEREGAARLSQALERTQLPTEVAPFAQEFVELFMRHPYINSGGARYLPLLRAEALLVEDFPEVPEPPAESPLLTALGLPRRRALSRLQIEQAIAAHGARILREQLALDPLECRLVCIPYDVYVRLGMQRGWGQQPQWTHFDGYQVMRGLKYRALAGGSVRYGGVVDLVSISRDDERDNVFARFAVVRRARLVARWR